MPDLYLDGRAQIARSICRYGRHSVRLAASCQFESDALGRMTAFRVLAAAARCCSNWVGSVGECSGDWGVRFRRFTPV